MSISSADSKGQNTRISEKQMLDYLREGANYPPVRLTLVSELSRPGYGQLGRARAATYDALVDLTWRDQTVRYTVEVKTSSQPAIIEKAMFQVQRSAQNSGLYPMIFVPYLSEEALLRLSDTDVSGIDRCGNCVILGPSMAIWRSGAPNRFRESRPIRNPYSGDGSIVARCFLLRRRFASLHELRRFALSRTQLKGAGDSNLLQLGTISKVVRALESEIIVTRGNEGILMTDARRLLDRLREQYRPGDPPRVVGKTPFSEKELWLRLAEARATGRGRSAATGMASASQYGALSGIERLSFYVDELDATSDLLEVTEGRAFANIELIEARNNLPFFDCLVEGSAVWASSIQTWLELAQGGAREQEAAKSLELRLLEGGAEEMI